MRRWMIGAVLALGIVAPAKASPFLITESGQYQVVGAIIDPVAVSFGITGNLLTPDRPQFAEISISITGGLDISGTGTGHVAFHLAQDQCANPPFCIKIFEAPQGHIILIDAAQLLDVNVWISGDPNNLALTYDFGMPHDSSLTLTRIGAVPEASTWAMMLLGFAGLGFMTYRRRSRYVLEDAARAA